MKKKIQVKEKTFDLESLIKTMEKEMNMIVNHIVSKADTIDDPLGTKKKKLREELFALTGKKDHWKRIPRGFDLIQKDLDSWMSQEELEEQRREFSKAVEKMNLLCMQKEDSSDKSIEKFKETPDSLQELFGISHQTIEYFYKSGSRYYENRLFKESADIFYVITLLNPFYFNAWIALGLSEMQSNHYDKALEAFAMATIMDLSAVSPHLYSAECYIHLNQDDIAKETLEVAEKILKKYPTEEPHRYNDWINKIKKSIQPRRKYV